MASETSRDVQLTFSIDGVSSQKVFVTGFEAHEAMSELFRVDLDLASEVKHPQSGAALEPLDLSKVTGAEAWLTLENDQGKRIFHGILARVQLLARRRKFYLYSATLVPRAYRLLYRRDSRIFQDRTLKQIAAKVLGDGKVTHSVKLKGNQEPHKREYCVQYQESDWNFVSRLMEEEGWFYYFDHAEGDHTLQVGNDSLLCPPITGSQDTLDYQPRTTAPEGEHVNAFTLEERVSSGKVTLNDFNFLKPDLSYRKHKAEEEDTELEVYEYPGGHPFPSMEEQESGSDEIERKDKHGSALPGLRLEEQRAGLLVGQGASDCIRFAPGHTFKLRGYIASPGGAAGDPPEYLLTMVVHRGETHEDLEAGATQSKVRYSNNFSCIPERVPYRPPRATRRPVVRGVQTAIVTGPPGSEIYTDKLGRVKVQFHWDREGQRDQNSSCFVRVSQLWAGQHWGAMFIPRVGHEVLVDFLEGDPSRPIITGRVYHATNKPPYTLPDEMTRSTVMSNSTPGGGGRNEICFEDKKGAEQLITHAEKDQNETVKNNLSRSVGNDQSVTVKRNRSATVQEQNDTLTVKKGTRAVTVKSGASLTVQAGPRAVDVTGGDYSVGVSGGNISEKASAAVSIEGTAGGVSVTGKGKGVTVDGKGGQGTSVKGDPAVIVNGTSKVVVLSPDVGIGDKKIVVNGTEVYVGSGEVTIAGKKVVIGTEGGTVTVDASGISVSGTKVSIGGEGDVSMTGGVVKIN